MWNRPLSLALLASALIHAELLALLSAPLAGRSPGPGPSGHGQALQVRIASGQGPEVPPEPRAGQADIRTSEPPLRHPVPAPDVRSRLGWDPYLPAALLDERPSVVVDIPVDPPELREHPQGGEIVLSLWIGADGAVEKIAVEENSLPTVFADSAVRGFQSAKFRPGKKDGRAVKSRLRVTVSYLPLPPAGVPVRAAGER